MVRTTGCAGLTSWRYELRAATGARTVLVRAVNAPDGFSRLAPDRFD